MRTSHTGHAIAAPVLSVAPMDGAAGTLMAVENTIIDRRIPRIIAAPGNKDHTAMATAAVEAKPATLNTAHYITQCLQRGVSHAEKMFSDIPADKFAFCAVKNANHPAFIVGHLCLYPN